MVRALWITTVLMLPACGALPARDKTEPESGTETPADTPATPAVSGTQPATSTTSTVTSPPATARPDQVCGKNGFAFLLYAYFHPQCGDCHGQNDIAAPDIEVSWPLMAALKREDILRVVTAGQFCTGDCRLTTDSSLYKDVEAWTAAPKDCPP